MLKFVEDLGIEMLQNAHMIRRWQFNRPETYSENVLLFTNTEQYWYLYVFHWFNDDSYTLEGIQNTEEPVKEENRFLSPLKINELTSDETARQVLA